MAVPQAVKVASKSSPYQLRTHSQVRQGLAEAFPAREYSFGAFGKCYIFLVLPTPSANSVRCRAQTQKKVTRTSPLQISNSKTRGALGG